MRYRIILTFFLLFVSSLSFSGDLQISRTRVTLDPSWLYTLDVRVGIQNPDGEPIGDVLYLPGFADRLDNHRPLFNAWADAGLRVISFDYPSHGETRGTSINLFSFRKLATVAYLIEQRYRQEKDRPLILSGWSTGGLLAWRMVQSPEFPVTDRWPKGMILFAPGIYVRTPVGEPSIWYPLGQVTPATLTHDPNPQHAGSAKPASPGSVPFFATDLMLNSLLSRLPGQPPHIPTLIFTAGENDRYVNTEKLQAWIRQQQSAKPTQIYGVEASGARHELDNEIEQFGGPDVRALAAQFSANVAKGDASLTDFAVTPCLRLLQTPLEIKSL